ncbi:hypothetical protein RLOC_00000720 [Lonchura striata]|uniref:Uncharacterized protein n=1 Tax=Lonchura striata TaxID=40157 RepID=A0A218U7F2_9PASE|nr:hypothetical protein RLOC_00000720 [Lonchura striata domestica]
MSFSSKATLADIVEQLQEKEAGGAVPASVLGEPLLRLGQGRPGLLQGRQRSRGRGHPRRGAPAEPAPRRQRGGQRLQEEEERLQAQMQGWLRALAASAQEHAELARWQQGLLTTSSTDEGLPRRDPDRPRRK